MTTQDRHPSAARTGTDGDFTNESYLWYRDLVQATR